MVADKPSPAQEANTMQSELKPCPFCGGNNLLFRLSDIEGWIAHVECTDCDDMLGPMSEFKHDDKEDAEKDAAEVWNRRHLEDELYARGYGLRCAIVDFLNGIGAKQDLRQRFTDWEAATGTRFSLSPAYRAALEAALSASEKAEEPRLYVSKVSLELLEAEGGHVALQTLIHRKPLRSGNGVALYTAPPAPSVAVKADEIDAIVEELLDAQQDINLAANSTMSQSLCDASALIDRVETLLKRVKASALSAQVQDVAEVSPVDYMRRHDAAIAAYEANTPNDYRYSALALRKAVDAAFAVASAPAKQEGGTNE